MTKTKEEEQALAQTKFEELRKQINADSWTDNMELLLKRWGEKAAGLRYMHAASGSYWKKLSNNLTIASILITTVGSTLSLVSANVEDEAAQTGMIYAVGGIGLVSALIQSFKKFYDAEEKAADHNAIAKQFGSFYRYMTLQMGMTRFDRDPADVLSTWALKEYERLQLEAPSLTGESVASFKNKFKNSSQSVPDVVEDEFIIEIYKEEDEKEEKDEKDEKEEKEDLVDPKVFNIEVKSNKDE